MEENEQRRGVDAFMAGDYAKAFQIFHPHCADGDVRSRVVVGALYLMGEGVAPDLLRGMRLLSEVAEADDPLGNSCLGYIRYKGLGVPRDEEEALRLWAMGADAGSSVGQHSLGWSYMRGLWPNDDGMYERHPTHAVQWFLRSAEQGNRFAMNDLAVAYWYGEGVEPDRECAVQWSLRAAEKGHAESLKFAGDVYWFGITVSSSAKRAADYYVAAAQAGANLSSVINHFIPRSRQNDPPAAYVMARLYEVGAGVGKDPDQARALYQSLPPEWDADI